MISPHLTELTGAALAVVSVLAGVQKLYGDVVAERHRRAEIAAEERAAREELEARRRTERLMWKSREAELMTELERLKGTPGQSGSG